MKPLVHTEYQLIYLCHVVGPFLHRLSIERARAVADITLMLYELLEQVDKAQPAQPLRYMDPICDLLYHIKYMFVGDTMKTELEAIIRRLRPALQMRLRFITRLNVEEIGVDQNAAAATGGGGGAGSAATAPGQGVAGAGPGVGPPPGGVAAGAPGATQGVVASGQAAPGTAAGPQQPQQVVGVVGNQNVALQQQLQQQQMGQGIQSHH